MASGVTKAWTREGIEAYLRGDNLPHDAHRRILLIERAVIVRLCPEAPDYHELAERHFRFTNGLPWDRATAGADEVRAGLEPLVAALWQQSLSESVEDEAPMNVTKSLEASDEHR